MNILLQLTEEYPTAPPVAIFLMEEINRQLALQCNVAENHQVNSSRAAQSRSQPNENNPDS